MKHFTDLVAYESLRAHQVHGPIHSLHEGYGLLIEEVDELFEEIRCKNPDRSKLATELVQIASICHRIHDDLLGGT